MLLQQMFGPEGYAASDANTADRELYIEVVDQHVAPAINMLSAEYFNNFDESC